MTASPPRLGCLPCSEFPATLDAHAGGRKKGLLILTVHDLLRHVSSTDELQLESLMADMIVPYESQTLTPIGIKRDGIDLQLTYYSPLLATSGAFPANVCLVLSETAFRRASASVPVRIVKNEQRQPPAIRGSILTPTSALTNLSERNEGWQEQPEIPESEAPTSWITREATGSLVAAAASSAVVGTLLRFLI